VQVATRDHGCPGGSQPLRGKNRVTPRVQTALTYFSGAVTDVLGLSQDDARLAAQPKEARGYARGVRNSSDSGSRRLRITALTAYLWPEFGRVDFDRQFDRTNVADSADGGKSDEEK
jgi:hypothetical protein